MLAIILKILSVLGIILLVLLSMAFILVLLVFFFPITYRVYGKKKDEMSAWVKINWLFGLLRIRFAYPEPGRLTVKLLFFKLFDSGESAEKEKISADTAGKKKAKAKKQGKSSGQTALDKTEKKKASRAADITERTQTTGQLADMSEKNGTTAQQTDTAEQNSKTAQQADGAEQIDTAAQQTETSAQNAAAAQQTDAAGQSGRSEQAEKIAKCEKIKYTFHKIYDKIKYILENISFYKNLLQEESTKELCRHALLRTGKILKNIRPRRLRADILFGTDSPDITGYAYGIYGMLCPGFGNDILVTPDFTQAILEGELYAAGHITIFWILLNGIILLLDKRLRMLIRKVKAHTASRKTAGGQT